MPYFSSLFIRAGFCKRIADASGEIAVAVDSLIVLLHQSIFLCFSRSVKAVRVRFDLIKLSTVCIQSRTCDTIDVCVYL